MLVARSIYQNGMKNWICSVMCEREVLDNIHPWLNLFKFWIGCKKLLIEVYLLLFCRVWVIYFNVRNTIQQPKKSKQNKKNTLHIFPLSLHQNTLYIFSHSWSFHWYLDCEDITFALVVKAPINIFTTVSAVGEKGQ